MDSHILEHFQVYSEQSPQGHFHQVISLHDSPGLLWEEVRKLCPILPRGWFELAHLTSADRIEFTRDFWLSKLPYHPDLSKGLTKFFGSLDDIGIFMTQQRFEDPFQVQLVYSLAEDSGFFRADPPAGSEEIIALQKAFPEYILPADYMAFLQIHDGFGKLNDTGTTKSTLMEKSYALFQEMLQREGAPLALPDRPAVNPKSLIPFYESFGMPFFQCFWADWYPDEEMGNVYYSGVTKMISDCSKADYRVETMAFETFTDWLLFYLEKID